MSQTHLYNGTSTENLSNTLSFGLNSTTNMPSSGGFSRNGAIYASQRNQYFANKKHKQENIDRSSLGGESRVLENLPGNKTNDYIDPKTNFFTTGLDKTAKAPGSYFYDKSQKSNESIISEEDANSTLNIIENNTVYMR